MAGQPEAKFVVPHAGDPALREAARRLAQACHPERIYLSGSVARGDAGPDSDHDIMLVVPDAAKAEKRRSRLADEALWGTDIAADGLVWTASLFNSRTRLPSSMIAAAWPGSPHLAHSPRRYHCAWRGDAGA